MSEIVKRIEVCRVFSEYKGFFEGAWAQSVNDKVEKSVLDRIFLDLAVAWKAASKAHEFPWTMIRALAAAEARQARIRHPVNLLMARAMRDRLAAEVGLGHSATIRLQRAMDKIYGELMAGLPTEDEDAAEIERELWEVVMTGPAGEVQLVILASQRLAYCSLMFAYEDYLQRCALIANPSLQAARTVPELGHQLTKTFGEALSEKCLSDAAVSLAREIRNSIAHRGGRINAKLESHRSDLRLIDDEIQIWPCDNRKLFGVLRDRVSDISNATVEKLSLGNAAAG